MTTVLHTRVMAGTGGGPEKTILRSARYAAGTPYRLIAAYLVPDRDPHVETLKRQAVEQSCPLLTFAERGPLDLRPLPKLLQVCRQMNVGIWHGHDYKSNLYGVLLRRYHPMRLVSTAHLWTDETWRLRLYKRVDFWALRRYERVMCVSQPIAKQCVSCGVDRSVVSVIPNGIEPEMFKRQWLTPVAKKSLGMDPMRFTIGFVGRLSVQKQLEPFVRHALPMIVSQRPDAMLILVGEGPERKAIEAAAKDVGCGDRLRFIGWQSDARPWYQAMDMLIQPSRDEGLPNSVLEAMAMGVPVAACGVGDVPELMGDTGIVLASQPARWAAPIVELANDAGRRAEMSQAGRERIERHYSFASRMASEFAVYDQLLSQPTSTRRKAA